MELPHVEKLYRELKEQGFGLVTITQNSAPDVQKMVDYNGITHPIVSSPDAAPGGVYSKYHAYDGKHYLIGSDGTILAAFSKLGVSLPILRKAIAKYGVGSAGSSGTDAAPDQRPRGPVGWTGTAPRAATTPGSQISVALAATIDAGWHIYAATQRSGGPVALQMLVAENQSFAIAGDIKSSAPRVKFDPNFGIDVHELEGRVQFVLPVAVARGAQPGRHTLKVLVRYQACNASICLPVQTDSVELPVIVSRPRSQSGTSSAEFERLYVAWHEETKAAPSIEIGDFSTVLRQAKTGDFVYFDRFSIRRPSS